MKYFLNHSEFELLRFLAETARGTWTHSYNLQQALVSQPFADFVQLVELPLHFLEEKKLIEIKVVEQGYLISSTFKVKITEAGYKRFLEEQDNLHKNQQFLPTTVL